MTLDPWVRDRDRCQECPGVRVSRVVEQSGARADFDHLPQIHHQYALADMADDGQVVRNKNQCEPELLLQVAQEVDDLGLDRHVKGRDRLVTDDDARAQDQGACLKDLKRREGPISTVRSKATQTSVMPQFCPIRWCRSGTDGETGRSSGPAAETPS